MNTLSHLIIMHRTVMAAYNAIPDEDWDGCSQQISKTMDEAREAVLKCRPTTLDEVRQKAEMMLACPSFAVWGDLDHKDIIAGFLPEVLS